MRFSFVRVKRHKSSSLVQCITCTSLNLAFWYLKFQKKNQEKKIVNNAIGQVGKSWFTSQKVINLLVWKAPGKFNNNKKTNHEMEAVRASPPVHYRHTWLFCKRKFVLTIWQMSVFFALHVCSECKVTPRLLIHWYPVKMSLHSKINS